MSDSTSAPADDREVVEWVYVTQTYPQVHVLRCTLTRGIIMPPTIEAHVPLQGTLTFYHADGFGLPVPRG